MLMDMLDELHKEAIENRYAAKYRFANGLLKEFSVGCSDLFYASEEDRTAEYWISTRKPLDTAKATFKTIVDNDDIGEEERNRYAKENGVYDYHLSFFPRAWMADIWIDFFKSEEAEESTTMEESINVEAPKEVEETHVHRHIYYGDGYNGTVYQFSAEMLYEDFITFLNSKGVEIDRLVGYNWYEDHDLITKEPIKSDQRISWEHKPGKPGEKSKTWTYLHVKPYTD